MTETEDPLRRLFAETVTSGRDAAFADRVTHRLRRRVGLHSAMRQVLRALWIATLAGSLGLVAWSVLQAPWGSLLVGACVVALVFMRPRFRLR